MKNGNLTHLTNEDRWLGYAGFPVINKDNYALGTFCLLNRQPSALSDKQITLVKGMCERIAHQIDTQTEQKEITAETVQTALKSFRTATNSADTSDLNDFYLFAHENLSQRFSQN